MSDVAHGPRRAPDLEVEAMADGIVVIHRGRGRVHYLNLTAAIVLELCSGEHDATEITRRLQTTFELSEPPRAETDECLRQLRSEGLIS